MRALRLCESPLVLDVRLGESALEQRVGLGRAERAPHGAGRA